MTLGDESIHRLRKPYKGYEIEIKAIPLAQPQRTVTAHVTIAKEGGSPRDEIVFESGKIFRDVNLALEAGFNLAKEKIDSGFPENE